MNEITQDNFINNTWEDGIYAVEFYTPMCVHCKLNAQILERNEERFKEQDITILKCDATKNPDLAQKFKIMSVPFMVIFKISGEQVNQVVIDKFNILQGKQMLDKIYEVVKSMS